MKLSMKLFSQESALLNLTGSIVKMLKAFGITLAFLVIALVPSIALYQPTESRKQYAPTDARWEYLPNYPNAQQISTTRTGRGYSFDGKPYVTMTFTSTNHPLDVFNFYKDVFRKRNNPGERWMLDLAKQDATALEFFSFGPEVQGGPLYRITVKTQQGAGKILVTVERTFEPGF